MQQIYKSFKGTVREFIAASVSVNGKSLDQPSISMMAQYGVIKKVGTVPRPKGKKGHEEIIYQVVGKAGMKVDYDDNHMENLKMRENANTLAQTMQW